MIFCKRKSKLFFLIFFFFILLIIIKYLPKQEEKQLIVTNNQTQSRINLIFNLEEWRFISLLNAKDQCDIPNELKSLANSLCKIYFGKTCKDKLPCQLINSSFKDIYCLNNGQINQQNSYQTNSISCQIGSSLNFFLNQSKPSIIIDSFTKFSNDLYLNELNNKYRNSDSIWGIKFNFESISNYPWNKDLNYLQLFDIKYGYDRNIYDFIPKPWLFNYIQLIQDPTKRLSIQQIIQMKKSNLYWTNQSSSVHSPILWMNSNCQTLSKRTEYLNELMKYIEIDNYGTCGKNILHLPNEIIELQKSKNKKLKDRSNYDWEKGKISLANHYLFTIAFENTFDNDYITEKIWHAFITGSVPIYYGAPNIHQWLPCEQQCIIDLNQFKTPKEAAEFIRNIAQNETLYLNYHLWRNKPLSQNFVNMIKYFEQMDNYNLECLLCYVSDKVKQGFNKQIIVNQLKQTLNKF